MEWKITFFGKSLCAAEINDNFPDYLQDPDQFRKGKKKANLSLMLRITHV